MKNQFVQLMFAAFAAVLFSSCTVPMAGGSLVIGNGGQQQGGHYGGHQQQGYGQYHQQRGTATTNSERCYVRIGADAPLQMVQAVENATATKVQALFAESCFKNNGQRGVWPDENQVNKVVQDLFEQKGSSLAPGADGVSGCFKVMEYKPGLPPG